MITEIGSQIIELREQGMSVRKIRAKLGCSSSTISKWCSSVVRNASIIDNNSLAMDQYRVATIRNRREQAFVAQLIKSDGFKPEYRHIWEIGRRLALREFIIISLGGECQICGYSKCNANLVTHHMDSNKEFDLIGRKLLNSIDRIINEASKCALVCCRCHGEIHNGYNHTLQRTDLSKIAIPSNLIEWYELRHPGLILETFQSRIKVGPAT